ncbi:MAG: hypothetical protein K2J10_05965 [Muribaculaceae bacterium]|nr:hypothetical protein [Muribaculaceae bacterium]
MKKSVYLFFVSGIALSTLCACSGGAGENDTLATVQIEKSFDAKDFDNITDKVEIVETFQPEFTDSSMFSLPFLLAIVDGKAYMHEGEWMTVFDYPSGKLTEAFNHHGPGPEEYMRSYYGYYQPATSDWTVFDDNNWGHERLVQYDKAGKFIRSVENDSIQSLSPINGGGWLAYNGVVSFKGGYHNVREKKIYQYDSDWQIENIYQLKERRWGAQGSYRMDEVLGYDGNNYVVDADTIYRIDTDNHELIAKIALNLGKYGCDWGALETHEEVRDAEMSHIYIQNPIFNSDYIFARYDISSDGVTILYYDVYRLSDGELVYRRKLPLEGDYGLCQFYEGFPVEVDGETVYGWPMQFVQDGCFFIIVASDEMARIKDTDEVNPTIVKIRIKD